jgi:hypothetical protein
MIYEYNERMGMKVYTDSNTGQLCIEIDTRPSSDTTFYTLVDGNQISKAKLDTLFESDLENPNAPADFASKFFQTPSVPSTSDKYAVYPLVL